MATDPKAAALALHRFGLGPRDGTITRIAGDPRGALLAELQKPNAGRVPATDVMNGAATLITLLEYRDAARQECTARRDEKRDGDAAHDDDVERWRRHG